jgi:hypothetical protein
MNLKKNLENRIRGWFPKESNLTSSNLNISGEEQKAKSWRHFLPLLIISYIFLIAVQVILYLLTYINASTLFGGVLVLLLMIPLVYLIGHVQIKYQHTKAIHAINKLAFIMGPACLAFPVTFIAVFFIFGVERMNALSSYVGYWPTIILLLVLPMMAGATIGYALGKRRNFEPYTNRG